MTRIDLIGQSTLEYFKGFAWFTLIHFRFHVIPEWSIVPDLIPSCIVSMLLCMLLLTQPLQDVLEEVFFGKKCMYTSQKQDEVSHTNLNVASDEVINSVRYSN